MHINVTKADIKTGSRHSAWRCPIAIAVNRSARVTNECELDCSATRILICIGSFHYKTPQAVIDFMNAFDAGKSVQPMAFELPEPLTFPFSVDNP